MIVVKVHGGLGNQMFQYAFGRSLAVRNSTMLYLDKGHTQPKHRPYELDNLNIVAEAAGDEEIRISKSFGYFCEKSFVYDESMINKQRGYFYGYWQSYKYFDDERVLKLLRVELKARLKEFDVVKGDDIDFCLGSPVALHVRRGDYVERQDYHNLCTVGYYLSAIDYIKRFVKDPVVFFFSDDIEWVKEELDNKIDLPKFYLGGNKSFEDMYLMSRCSHFICSSSTFAWWSAWLGTDRNKIVVCPKKWFANVELQKQTVDLIPTGWIRL